MYLMTTVFTIEVLLHLREEMCDVHCTSARLTPFSEGHYGNSDMDLVRMQLRGGANRIVALHDMGEGFVKARPVSTTTTLIPSSYMYSNSALHVNAHKGLAIMSNIIARNWPGNLQLRPSRNITKITVHCIKCGARMFAHDALTYTLQ